jgi:hypothetical protein
MKLEPMTLCYEWESPAGYQFVVNAHRDPEWGWQASIQLTVNGMGTAEAAVAKLAQPAREFLRQLEEKTP